MEIEEVSPVNVIINPLNNRFEQPNEDSSLDLCCCVCCCSSYDLITMIFSCLE